MLSTDTLRLATESARLCREAFEGNYGTRPIREEFGSNPVGGVSRVDDEIHGNVVYVYFRGQRYSLREAWHCLSVWKRSVSGIGITGKVHQGMARRFELVRSSVVEQVRACLEEIDGPAIIAASGHSRGSAQARLNAASLKENFPDVDVSVFTFSSMAIFDREAAESCNTVMGENKTTLFEMEGDVFPRLSERLGFYQGLEPVTLRPEESDWYNNHVERGEYPFANPGVSCLFSAQTWNAHQIPTYHEALSSVYETAREAANSSS